MTNFTFQDQNYHVSFTGNISFCNFTSVIIRENINERKLNHLLHTQEITKRKKETPLPIPMISLLLLGANAKEGRERPLLNQISCLFSPTPSSQPIPIHKQRTIMCSYHRISAKQQLTRKARNWKDASKKGRDHERRRGTDVSGAQTRTRKRPAATSWSTRNRSPGASIPSSFVTITTGTNAAAAAAAAESIEAKSVRAQTARGCFRFRLRSLGAPGFLVWPLLATVGGFYTAGFCSLR